MSSVNQDASVPTDNDQMSKFVDAKEEQDTSHISDASDSKTIVDVGTLKKLLSQMTDFSDNFQALQKSERDAFLTTCREHFSLDDKDDKDEKDYKDTDQLTDTLISILSKISPSSSNPESQQNGDELKFLLRTVALALQSPRAGPVEMEVSISRTLLTEDSETSRLATALTSFALGFMGGAYWKSSRG